MQVSHRLSKRHLSRQFPRLLRHPLGFSLQFGDLLLQLLPLHRRDGAGFRRENLAGPDAILDLPEVGTSIPLSDLYRDVD